MLTFIEPRAKGTLGAELIIHLSDIRCVDPIKVTYDLKRNGWVISKRKNTEKALEEDIWYEVTFILGDEE